MTLFIINFDTLPDMDGDGQKWRDAILQLLADGHQVAMGSSSLQPEAQTVFLEAVYEFNQEIIGKLFLQGPRVYESEDIRRLYEESDKRPPKEYVRQEIITHFKIPADEIESSIIILDENKLETLKSVSAEKAIEEKLDNDLRKAIDKVGVINNLLNNSNVSTELKQQLVQATLKQIEEKTLTILPTDHAAIILAAEQAKLKIEDASKDYLLNALTEKALNTRDKKTAVTQIVDMLVRNPNLLTLLSERWEFMQQTARTKQEVSALNIIKSAWLQSVGPVMEAAIKDKKRPQPELMESLLQHDDMRKALSKDKHQFKIAQAAYGKSIKKVADDLTRISRRLFVELREIENTKSNERMPESQRNITNYANKLSYRVMGEILSAASLSKRTAVMERWIAVMKQAYDKGDFESMTAINAAFENSAITRLHSSMDGLSETAKEFLKEIADNYKTQPLEKIEWMNKHGEQNKKIIPFYGAYRTVLTTAAETEDPTKITQVVSRLQTLQEEQKTLMAADPEQTTYIKFDDIVTTAMTSDQTKGIEKKNYEQSLSLEERRTGDIKVEPATVFTHPDKKSKFAKFTASAVSFSEHYTGGTVKAKPKKEVIVKAEPEKHKPLPTKPKAKKLVFSADFVSRVTNYNNIVTELVGAISSDDRKQMADPSVQSSEIRAKRAFKRTGDLIEKLATKMKEYKSDRNPANWLAVHVAYRGFKRSFKDSKRHSRGLAIFIFNEQNQIQLSKANFLRNEVGNHDIHPNTKPALQYLMQQTRVAALLSVAPNFANSGTYKKMLNAGQPKSRVEQLSSNKRYLNALSKPDGVASLTIFSKPPYPRDWDAVTAIIQTRHADNLLDKWIDLTINRVPESLKSAQTDTTLAAIDNIYTYIYANDIDTSKHKRTLALLASAQHTLLQRKAESLTTLSRELFVNIDLDEVQKNPLKLPAHIDHAIRNLQDEIVADITQSQSADRQALAFERWVGIMDYAMRHNDFHTVQTIRSAFMMEEISKLNLSAAMSLRAKTKYDEIVAIFSDAKDNLHKSRLLAGEPVIPYFSDFFSKPADKEITQPSWDHKIAQIESLQQKQKSLLGDEPSALYSSFTREPEKVAAEKSAPAAKSKSPVKPSKLLRTNSAIIFAESKNESIISSITWAQQIDFSNPEKKMRFMAQFSSGRLLPSSLVSGKQNERAMELCISINKYLSSLSGNVALRDIADHLQQMLISQPSDVRAAMSIDLEKHAFHAFVNELVQSFSLEKIENDQLLNLIRAELSEKTRTIKLYSDHDRILKNGILRNIHDPELLNYVVNAAKKFNRYDYLEQMLHNKHIPLSTRLEQIVMPVLENKKVDKNVRKHMQNLAVGIVDLELGAKRAQLDSQVKAATKDAEIPKNLHPSTLLQDAHALHEQAKAHKLDMQEAVEFLGHLSQNLDKITSKWESEVTDYIAKPREPVLVQPAISDELFRSEMQKIADLLEKLHTAVDTLTVKLNALEAEQDASPKLGNKR